MLTAMLMAMSIGRLTAKLMAIHIAMLTAMQGSLLSILAHHPTTADSA